MDFDWSFQVVSGSWLRKADSGSSVSEGIGVGPGVRCQVWLWTICNLKITEPNFKPGV